MVNRQNYNQGGIKMSHTDKYINKYNQSKLQNYIGYTTNRIINYFNLGSNYQHIVEESYHIANKFIQKSYFPNYYQLQVCSGTILHLFALSNKQTITVAYQAQESKLLIEFLEKMNLQYSFAKNNNHDINFAFLNFLPKLHNYQYKYEDHIKITLNDPDIQQLMTYLYQ